MERHRSVLEAEESAAVTARGQSTQFYFIWALTGRWCLATQEMEEYSGKDFPERVHFLGGSRLAAVSCWGKLPNVIYVGGWRKNFAWKLCPYRLRNV